jgi:hypothetical protein
MSSNEKDIKRLSDMRDEVVEILNKYNRLASRIDFNIRLGLLESEAMEEDGFGKKVTKNKTWDDIVNDGDGSETSVTPIATEDFAGWFSSSICSGY